MNDKKILTAVALAIVATTSSAQSSVQLFGLMDVNIYHKQFAGQVATTRQDGGGLSTSHWGLRGSEVLGGGLKAQFEVSAFFRPDTGQGGRSDTDPFFSRSSWVGLQDNWGSVRMGRQTTLGFTNMIRYSALGGSSSFNPSFLHNYLASASQSMLTGSGATDSAWNNTLSYATPNLSGFTGAIYYAPSEGSTAGKRWGGSLSFTRDAFSAGLVGEQINDMSLNVAIPPTVALMKESTVWNLGASYDFKVVKVFGQAITTKLSNATTSIDLDTLNFGVSVPVGQGKVLASYGETKKSQTRLPDAKRKTTTVGYDYNLSKRTDVYAMLMHDTVTKLRSGNGFAIGLRHSF